MVNEILKNKVREFPKSPGIYLMKNEKGECLYVGKAQNLRKRVGDYFAFGRETRRQIKFLMAKVNEIETIVTSNEKEALLLENTLIKKHRPKYNFFLKDDKSYLSLKLNISHDFPRLDATRNIQKDGSLYFGPYTSAFSAREVLDFIESHFKLRTCSEHDFKNRSRPCLQYQIKRCDAPCVGFIQKQDYQGLVKQVILFLQNKSRELQDLLKEKMAQASENLQFEEAARVRDTLRAIQATFEKQQVVKYFASDQDVWALAREGEKVSALLMIYRQGRLMESKHYPLAGYEEEQEILENLLVQYYQAPPLIPPEILLSLHLENEKLLEEILRERKKYRVYLRVPEKGDKLRKIELAKQNAVHHLHREVLTEQYREEVLVRLQEKFDLKKIPRRIECYDISNLQGKNSVGSCVSFIDGEPDKKSYRKFKIKTIHQANDFAMMYEVLNRRLKHADWPFPDLIVIDGGKGQLHSAHAALKDLGVLNIDLIALAKEKLLKGQNKPERVFLLGRKDAIELKPHTSEFSLLVNLRDEAHRFGITFHRQIRGKSSLISQLDQIEGVGPARKRQLLKHFGNIKKIAKASKEDFSSLKGFTPALVEKVLKTFHPLS